MQTVQRFVFPTDLDQATDLLATGREQARAIAGGTSLIFRRGRGFETLVDLSRLGLNRIERDETRLSVRRALDRLPERQREAVFLRSHQDLSYREIASVMNVTLPAVESLLQRGMAALRKELCGGREVEAGPAKAAAGEEVTIGRKK